MLRQLQCAHAIARAAGCTLLPSSVLAAAPRCAVAVPGIGPLSAALTVLARINRCAIALVVVPIRLAGVIGRAGALGWAIPVRPGTQSLKRPQVNDPHIKPVVIFVGKFNNLTFR